MTVKRTDLKTELRKALKNGEIVPYFQPLVQIRTGVVSGFEVLARWPHPVRGMVPPDEFIPLCEQAGLIGELTETILLQAFAAAAALPINIKLSVNISPIQLRDASLPQQIRRAAEQGAFPLDHLTAEITESALVHNLEQASSIAAELKNVGVKLALDDFGTGYSSLRNLQAIPFDELKVDRSFVNSMISNRDSRKIVAAVIGLGQSLNLTTVGEGVETIEQADMLLWLGCELGQGWLYGRAVSAPYISQTLSARLPAACDSRGKSPTSDLVAYLEQLPSQRRAQYQAIYDGAPVGLCYLDTEFRYVSINQRLADINGASVAAHIGHRVAEIVTPDFYSEIEPYFLRALKGEAVLGVDITRARPHEAPGHMTILIHYQPARDEAGEVVGISIAVVDITKFKQAEEALRESEDHYRHMVHSNPQIPWVMDSDGVNTEVGPQWGQITGQTIEQIANMGYLEVIHPEDVAAFTPTVRNAIKTGNPIDIEYRIRKKEGGWLWMRSRGKARRGPDGEILRWYGTTEDADDHKKVKHALREARAKLRALLEEKQHLNTVTVDSLLQITD